MISLISGDELSWSIYPIETIIAEKLHAIVARGDANSRSKDVYDLMLFLPRADEKVLSEAIEKCFEFRKTEMPESFVKLLKQLDTSILEKGWASATVSIDKAPKFKTTFEALTKMLEARRL